MPTTTKMRKQKQKTMTTRKKKHTKRKKTTPKKKKMQMRAMMPLTRHATPPPPTTSTTMLPTTTSRPWEFLWILFPWGHPLVHQLWILILNPYCWFPTTTLGSRCRWTMTMTPKKPTKTTRPMREIRTTFLLHEKFLLIWLLCWKNIYCCYCCCSPRMFGDHFHCCRKFSCICIHRCCCTIFVPNSRLCYCKSWYTTKFLH